MFPTEAVIFAVVIVGILFAVYKRRTAKHPTANPVQSTAPRPRKDIDVEP
jgi:hypothetical protein